MDFTGTDLQVNDDETYVEVFPSQSPESKLPLLHGVAAMLAEKRKRLEQVEMLRDAVRERAAAYLAKAEMAANVADTYDMEMDELAEHIARMVAYLREEARPYQHYQHWSNSPASKTEDDPLLMAS